MPRHYIGQNDLSPTELLEVLQHAARLKVDPISNLLHGRSLVMFFEKASTRTRLSFEIGMTQLGGHAVYVDPQTSHLSRGESIADTACVVSRYADIIMARVNSHSTVTELAKWASIPVINGLSDEEHPCQSLAALQTILERKGRLQGIRLAYVGDGNNNVTHSLMLAATQVGIDMRVAAPDSLMPDRTYVEIAHDNARRFGGSVTLTTDPVEAVRNADVVYTDVWVSMGRESDTSSRLEQLQPYQVNGELVKGAATDYLFMHCLPAHIGEEVTEDIAYSPHSVIFDEAENRLHVQKALLLFLLQSTPGGVNESGTD